MIVEEKVFIVEDNHREGSFIRRLFFIFPFEVHEAPLAL